MIIQIERVNQEAKILQDLLSKISEELRKTAKTVVK